MILDLWEEELSYHAKRIRTALRLPENAPINIEVPREIWMQFSIQRLANMANKHRVFVLDGGDCEESG